MVFLRKSWESQIQGGLYEKFSGSEFPGGLYKQFLGADRENPIFIWDNLLYLRNAWYSIGPDALPMNAFDDELIKSPPA